MPNRAATAHKPYEEWKEMKDENFIFSLYSRDLIHVVGKRDIKFKKVVQGCGSAKEIFAYFTSANISTASIAGKADDSRYEFESLGIQSLEVFEKCQVDILGNISVVRKEKRMGFN